MTAMQTDFFRSAEVQAPVMVAYGAGVDSTAMLIEMIERGERIDIALFADTGSEKPETYAYLEMFRGWLADRGVRLITVRYEPRNFKHYPPYRTLDENCFTNGTLPSISFGFSSCSQKWKVEPQNAWTERWEPAVAAWAAGKKVVKCIGYDCSPADAKRYAHAEGYQDDRYEYRYPLREWGWKREDCIARIERAGLPVPVKSACFMCGASKPWEIEALPVQQLRRIVLMEARAAPRLTKSEGLWRKSVAGMRGATARPGSMTVFIRDKGLLPAEEIEQIVEMAPRALLKWQEAQAAVPIDRRQDLRAWLLLFDARDARFFDVPGARPLYSDVERIEA